MYKLAIILSLCVCALCAAEKRTWKDRKGQSMVGEFVRIDGEYVVLKRSKDGKLKMIKMMMLVPSDRGYLAKIQSKPTSSSGSDGERTTASSDSDSTVLFSLSDQPKEKIYAVLGGLVIVNILLMLALGKMIFGGWREFGQCLMFWFQPDWISAFRGEFAEDFFSSLKIVFFIGLMIASVIGELMLIGNFIL
jgi:hypothetical protein